MNVYLRNDEIHKIELEQPSLIPNRPINMDGSAGSMYGLYHCGMSLVKTDDGWYKYDAKKKLWQKFSSKNQEAFNLSPVAIGNNILCIVGRSSLVELMEIQGGADTMKVSWSKCRTTLPRKAGAWIFPCNITKSGPNTVIITGGFDNMSDPPWTFLTDVHEGTLAANNKKILWRQLPSLSTPRGFHLAFKLKDKFIVAGGIADNNDHLMSSEIYDTNEKTWSMGPDLPFSPLGLGEQGTMICPFVTVDPEESFALIMGWLQEEPESLKIIEFKIGSGFRQLKDIEVRRPPLSQHIVAVATSDPKAKKLKVESDGKLQKQSSSKGGPVAAGYGFGKRAK